MNKRKFKKKIYRKLDSSPLSSSIAPTSLSSSEPPKKIIPSTEEVGLREKFKKTFLPLLIEVFELRQTIDNYKTGTLEAIKKSPEEIMNDLEELQQNIEEIQRWSEGVTVQITKGLEEAQELFGEKESALPAKFFRKITPRFRSTFVLLKTEDIVKKTRKSFEKTKDPEKWIAFTKGFCKQSTSPIKRLFRRIKK